MVATRDQERSDKPGGDVPLYRDADWLRAQYLDKSLSACQIARQQGWNPSTVYTWLRRHSIPVRSLSEATRAAWVRGDYNGREHRRKLSEAQKAAFDPATPEGRERRRRQGEITKAAYDPATPAGRKRRHKASRASRAACDPTTSEGRERRRKIGERVRAAFDPTTPEGRERRRKQAETSRAFCNPATPEGRERRRKIGERVRVAFDPTTPEGRERRRQASKRTKATFDPTTPEGRERRRQHSETMKAAYDPTTLKGQERRRAMSETTRAAWARGVFDGVFQSPTKPEIALSDALDALGVKHTSQYCPAGCPYTFDEFIEPNIWIEYNGDYWHVLPGRRERGARKAQWARGHGYILIVLWGGEIKAYTLLALLKTRVIPLLPAPAREVAAD